MKNSGLKLAQSYLDQILGMTPTRITLGHGSFITLDFGKDVIAEIKTRTGLRTCSFGEWHLWVYMCAWRFDKGGLPLIGSDDDRDKISEILSDLPLKTLTHATVLNDAYDVTFTFGEDIQLHLFSFSAQKDHEQWKFFTPNDNVFTAGPGSEWEISD